MTDSQKITDAIEDAIRCIKGNTNLNRDCTDTIRMLRDAQKEVKKLIIPDIVGSALPCPHPYNAVKGYHDNSKVCNACNCVIEQNGESIDPPCQL
jgi:hypothetical protein